MNYSEVITLNGFKYFKVGSRYCRVISIDGELVYTDTYRAKPLNDDFKEPDDNEFMVMLSNQQRGKHE